MLMCSTFQPHIHLAWKDVSVDSVEKPKILRIHLKVSKCDQFGNSIDIFLGCIESPMCPVHGDLWSSTRPLLSFSGWQPSYKESICHSCLKCIGSDGPDQSLYAGHSFRIGAVTAAAQAGVEDSIIKALGRWSSAAFLTYIRTPRQTLAALTTHIGGLQ